MEGAGRGGAGHCCPLTSKTLNDERNILRQGAMIYEMEMFENTCDLVNYIVHN